MFWNSYNEWCVFHKNKTSSNFSNYYIFYLIFLHKTQSEYEYGKPEESFLGLNLLSYSLGFNHISSQVSLNENSVYSDHNIVGGLFYILSSFFSKTLMTEMFAFSNVGEIQEKKFLLFCFCNTWWFYYLLLQEDIISPLVNIFNSFVYSNVCKLNNL